MGILPKIEEIVDESRITDEGNIKAMEAPLTPKKGSVTAKVDSSVGPNLHIESEGPMNLY